jgi:hypothetical protein
MIHMDHTLLLEQRNDGDVTRLVDKKGAHKILVWNVLKHFFS